MKIIYIFVMLKLCYCFYLTSKNHNLINTIIKSKNTSTSIRKKVNNILYLGYENGLLKRH